MENICQQCGAPVDQQAPNCKFCGAVMYKAPAAQQQQPQYQQPPQQQYQQPYQQQQYAQPVYVQPMYQQPVIVQTQYVQQPVYTTDKSKTTAGVLGIFLGGIGAHHFYLGHVGLGIVYLLFCWTFIPAFAGFIEGIVYLTTSDEQFARKNGRRLN